MAVFNREKDMEHLIASIGNKKIKIITGIRRCGKTYFLRDLMPEELKKLGLIGHKSDVLIIELKGKDINIKTKNQLRNFLTQKSNITRKFIVIDEVQKIKDYHNLLIDLIQKYPEKEIFITGSNSKILSNDILVHFQEMGHDIHLAPLTFKEIREVISNYSVDDYLRYGGLPYVVNLGSPEKKEEELNKIYCELYEADIKDRVNKNYTYISKKMVRDAIRVIFSTSSEISTKGIADRIGKRNDQNTYDYQKLETEIENLIELLIDSYLIQEFENDSFNSLNILKNIGLNKKYYCTDNGLLYVNCDDKKRIDGIVLENAVYLYLVSLGLKPKGKIILGKKNQKDGEIDFNYSSSSKEDYHIQVTWTLHDGDYESEVGNLLKFNDSSRKILVYRYDELKISRSLDAEYIDVESYLLCKMHNFKKQ